MRSLRDAFVLLAAVAVWHTPAFAQVEYANPPPAAPGTIVVVPPAGSIVVPPAAIPPVAPAPKVAGPEALVTKSVKDLATGRIGAAVKDDVKALQRGPLLIHGNYCGIGNRPGTKPTDVLDAACMRHDACTVDGNIPKCGCDEALYRAATAIAADPQTPPDLKVTAGATATAMSLLICKK